MTGAAGPDPRLPGGSGTGPLGDCREGTARRIARTLPSRELARAMAELFRMLAVGFSYPETRLLEATRRQLGAAQVACAEGRLPTSLKGALRTAARHWRMLELDDVRAEYSRLYLGTALVPLREGGYGDGMRFAGQPVDLADLNGFYLAFGFGPPTAEASPPDHLGVELEFISLLYLKIAYTVEQRQIAQARITQAALASFLSDHFGRWFAAFGAALRRESAHPAYAALAGVLTRAVGHECHRLGIRPCPAGPGTRPDPVGADALDCPLAQGARRAAPLSC